MDHRPIKPLKENTGENLGDPELGRALRHDTKSPTKENINKLYCIKIKDFHSMKFALKMKRQATDGENPGIHTMEYMHKNA